MESPKCSTLRACAAGTDCPSRRTLTGPSGAAFAGACAGAATALGGGGAAFTAGVGDGLAATLAVAELLTLLVRSASFEQAGIAAASIQSARGLRDGIGMAPSNRAPQVRQPLDCQRSEERRVGKECRSRWSRYH